MEPQRDADASWQLVNEWLDTFPASDGFVSISPAHSFGGSDGEEEYAQQFGMDDTYCSRISEGLRWLLDETGADRLGGALELGCGSGILSVALTALRHHPAYYLTDVSPRFLRMTRDCVGTRQPELADHTRYMILAPDDLDIWPGQSLSLVALRYVLHHVLDWQQLIRRCAPLLRPGGVLLFEEPCSDGFLLQAMMMATARRTRPPADPEVGRNLDFFIGTLQWYLRTGVDKSRSEDKHVFRVSQVIATAARAGLQTRFYPNVGLETIAENRVPGETYFVDEFRHNLRVNFGFNDATIAYFDDNVAPVCDLLAPLAGDSMGPYVKGVFVCQAPTGAS